MAHMEFDPLQLYQMDWSAQSLFGKAFVEEASAIWCFWESFKGEHGDDVGPGNAIDAFRWMLPAQQFCWVSNEALNVLQACPEFQQTLLHIARQGGFSDDEARHYI